MTAINPPRQFSASVPALLAVLATGCASPGLNAPDSDAGRQIAAAVPSNDIYLASLHLTDTSAAIGALKNITAMPGYQNQPAFAPDGSGLWYTAIADGAQADLWWFNFAGRRHEQITSTPESEYSPTPMPDGSGLSAVRVEADGNQRLWEFSLLGEPRAPLLPRVFNVGYHHWLDADRLALFIVGEPHSLQIATLSTGAVETVASNIGRGMARIPHRNALSFIDKSDPENWRIAEFDADTGSVTTLTSTRPGAEDFAWTVNATLIMADGKRLYSWRAGCDWEEIANLEADLPGKLTRVSISADGQRIALVAAEADEPDDKE